MTVVSIQLDLDWTIRPGLNYARVCVCVGREVCGRLAATQEGEAAGQRGNDRWEETASDKGRTGWEDFYWQAAQSKVRRTFGHKPSTTSPETSSVQISTFPLAFQSFLKPLPAFKWQLSFTEVSRQQGYNPCISQMSQRRWPNIFAAVPCVSLGSSMSWHAVHRGNEAFWMAALAKALTISV